MLAAAGEEGEPFLATATGDASRATAQARFIQGHAKTDGEKLLEQEGYWLGRHTFPTGRFDPAWLRRAARQDAQIERRNPDGSTARISAKRLKASPVGLSTTAFTALGPQPERMTGCSGCYDYTTTQGRVNSIVVDPTTTTPGSIVAYAASLGGGVWKTTNCCSSDTTWTVKTDDPLISTTSIDSLTFDPNDHNTIYAGTGDLNYGSFSMGSQGILKSTDAGATWTVLGADVFGAMLPEPPGEFPQYQSVGKVRVDPNDSSKVVAGTKTGLYISYNGGTSWTGPCLTNSFTSMRQDITGLELSNISGTTRIIAAVGVRGFATTVQYNLGQNGANGLYKGTVPASGCPTDFTSISDNTNGFVYGDATTTYGAGANMNATSGTAYVNSSTGNQLGRIDIGVAPSDPNTIYAQVQSIAANSNGGCGNTAGCQLGAWATTDGGATWTYMAGSAGQSLRACAGSGPGSSGNGDYPQNWYDQGVVVDPNDADRVFFDTFEIWLATRTGTTWYDTTCGYTGPSPKPVHVDQHALAFLPGSSSLLLAGNDGGIHGTANADAAALNTTRPTWFNMDGGLNTIEFYSGDISGYFATSDSPEVNGGAQDNGPSSATFSGSPTGPIQWQMGLGGDGFFARIDPIGTGPTQAQGTITLTTGGALAGETFVIGAQTFTWQAAARSGVGEVQIASSTTTAGNNIVAAVNADLAGVVTASRSGATVVVTAVVEGASGNSIPFTESSTNMTMNGSGTLGGTTLGGLPGSLRFWQGNNSGGLSRCIRNCTVSPATWTSKRGAWTGDQQSFILPFDIFHGDPGNPANDCGPEGPGSGCGHLIAGTVRVWETITGAAAGTGGTVTLVRQQPAEPDQGDARQPLVHQSAHLRAEGSDQGHRRHQRRQRPDRTQHGHRLERVHLDRRHRRQHRPAPPPGPRCHVRSDHHDRSHRLRGRRRFQRQHAVHAGPCLPGGMHRRLRHLHLGGQERQPAGHPGGFDRRQSEFPAAGFRGHRLRPLLHGQRQPRLPDLVPLLRRASGRDDLGHADRSRRHDALALDAQPRRLRVAAAVRTDQQPRARREVQGRHRLRRPRLLGVGEHRRRLLRRRR